ncbi:MAG: hypothetical protein Q8N68_01370 [bacterium]|nr:hypothetical protein [bacterium]
MKYLDLRRKVKSNLFTVLDVAKFFPAESEQNIKIQLSRLAKKGLLTSLKRGLYCFDPQSLDELSLAGRLYSPSCVSLESALNYYGVLPDVPQTVTSITPTTTKTIKAAGLTFAYSKIDPTLYFGYVLLAPEGFIAQKEKALLDYFYLRKIRQTADLRLKLEGFDHSLYQKYAQSFPTWVRRIKI